MKGIIRRLLLVMMIVSLFSCSTSAVMEKDDVQKTEYIGLGVSTEVLVEFSDFNFNFSPALDANWLYKDESNLRLLTCSFKIPTVYDHGVNGLLQESGFKISGSWMKAMGSGIVDFLAGGGFGGSFPLALSAHAALGMDWQINDSYLFYLLVSPNLYATYSGHLSLWTTVNANLGVVMKYDFQK